MSFAAEAKRRISASRTLIFAYRLTETHAKKIRFTLSQNTTLIQDEQGFRTWYLSWQPSHKDRKSNPHLPQDVTIEVFVHQIELEGEQNLYLVSNAEADAASLAALYLRRSDVEFVSRSLIDFELHSKWGAWRGCRKRAREDRFVELRSVLHA